jgi:hypothetical protein
VVLAALHPTPRKKRTVSVALRNEDRCTQHTYVLGFPFLGLERNGVVVVVREDHELSERYISHAKHRLDQVSSLMPPKHSAAAATYVLRRRRH